MATNSKTKSTVSAASKLAELREYVEPLGTNRSKRAQSPGAIALRQEGPIQKATVAHSTYKIREVMDLI